MRFMVAKDSRWRHWLVVGFFLGLLLLGLAIVRDYGLSYDAGASRNIGLTSLRYVAEKLNPEFIEQPDQKSAFNSAQTPLHWFSDRDYGVAYELPVTLGERLLRLPDLRTQFLFRHLCTFLVSWIGVLALYGLGKQRYQDWRIGLAGALLLVLSPRLFGEFFYNDKDAVFMALSTVATYTAVRFLETPNWRWAMLHALGCAIAIDVRIMAVLWPVTTLVVLAWRAGWSDYKTLGQRQLLGALALYVVLLPGLVVLLWPYLWEDSWQNFREAFDHMKSFRWENYVLYRGEMVFSTYLPWHYVVKWLAITTPLVQLALLVSGIGLVVRQLVRHRWRFYAAGTRQWQDLLFLLLGVGPVVAVITFHSVLYDGWRQMYFIYPSLLLLALRGLVVVMARVRAQPRWQHSLVVGVLVVGLLSSAGQLIWMHPFQSLYFSVLAGPNVTQRYEQDYWGIAYGAGLRWIVAHDDRPVVRVCTDSYMRAPLVGNYELLPEDQHKRLQLVDEPQDADYYLANYRWHPQDYDMPHKVHDVMAGNQRIMTIFKLGQ